MCWLSNRTTNRFVDFQNAGHDPEGKNNLLKMIRSFPSGVLANSGGLYHPETLCVDAKGNHSLQCARSNQGEK